MKICLIHLQKVRERILQNILQQINGSSNVSENWITRAIRTSFSRRVFAKSLIGILCSDFNYECSSENGNETFDVNRYFEAVAMQFSVNLTERISFRHTLFRWRMFSFKFRSYGGNILLFWNDYERFRKLDIINYGNYYEMNIKERQKN